MIPLAEKLRPQSIDELIGQKHLVGTGKPIRKMLENQGISSMILWGPPGVGKTTLAKIIGKHLNLPFHQLSAISAGVAEVRKIIEDAKKEGKILLFLDEIHRFNKNQQDALLGAVESGLITLIGATTENPSFEVNMALLSRCQVFTLEELSKSDLQELLEKAIDKLNVEKNYNITLSENEAILQYSGGDGRKLLNILELLFQQINHDFDITNEWVKNILQEKTVIYDKAGEEHYNTISAFIKSIRGSDPNAAVFYLAKMLLGGEKPEFIARRMLILASEDIGNANPTALVLANSTMQSVMQIGMPESRIILSQCAIYLACSAKSNASYVAIGKAYEMASKNPSIKVPLHLRNAPTKLMKDLNYGKDYEYAHSYQNNFVDIEFLPNEILGTQFYEPGNNAREKEMKEFLKLRWKEKYKY